MPPSLAVLTEQARIATRQAKAAWTFIFDPKTDPLPQNFEMAVRAMVLRGANENEIVGAITLAAMHQPINDRWSYACGIVRKQLREREKE